MSDFFDFIDGGSVNPPLSQQEPIIIEDDEYTDEPYNPDDLVDLSQPLEAEKQVENEQIKKEEEDLSPYTPEMKYDEDTDTMVKPTPQIMNTVKDPEVEQVLGPALDPNDYYDGDPNAVEGADEAGNIGTPIGTQADEPSETLGTAAEQTSPSGGLDDLLRTYLEAQGGSKFNLDSKTVQGMSGEDKKELVKAVAFENKMRTRLAIAQSEIGKAKANEIAKAHDDYIEDKNTTHSDYVKKVNYVQQQMDAIQSDLNDILKKQVDPDRYLKNMSSTDRFWGAIAAGMEAGFNAFAGTNYKTVVDTLNRNISNDIAMQKEAILNQKETIEGKKNLLKEKLDQSNDIKEAENKLHAETLTASLAKINALAEGGLAGLDPKKAELLNAELTTKIKEKTAELETAVWRQKEGPSLKDIMELSDKIKESTENTAGKKYSGEYTSKLPNGKYVVFNDKIDARKFREAQAAALEINKNVSDLKKELEETGLGTKLWGKITPFDTAGEKSLKSKIKSVQMVLKNILQLGVLAGPDMEIIDQMTGNDPNALFITDGVKLDNLLSFVQNSMRKKVEAKGFAVVNSNQVVSPAEIK